MMILGMSQFQMIAYWIGQLFIRLQGLESLEPTGRKMWKRKESLSGFASVVVAKASKKGPGATSTSERKVVEDNEKMEFDNSKESQEELFNFENLEEEEGYASTQKMEKKKKPIMLGLKRITVLYFVFVLFFITVIILKSWTWWIFLSFSCHLKCKTWWPQLRRITSSLWSMIDFMKSATTVKWSCQRSEVAAGTVHPRRTACPKAGKK